MAGDVVNLRMARKRKDRKDRETKAEQNRISFGRTKAERQHTSAENERIARLHDAGRREADDSPAGD
ncbi:DUF4169 family protein [Pseudohoeflea suaedae]|uniref:DUF4169 family protein n=1 Tax=Pseudohoeflea suaedae TaxID=877384 RepID=A0A4R5PH43_9HYPH|nr:DUF4169 family protein [Pseudohoeflea suaedae]TDH34216.1 DUF4169 family protein [Pseudohoeflea suaedae]